MLYISTYCVHTLNTQKNAFQTKQSKHFHKRNRFTSCETSSNKVKLPKVGSNAIVPAPTGPNKQSLQLGVRRKLKGGEVLILAKTVAIFARW
jgi:hypothetical protein